jgi:hypothetical protein
MIDTSFTYLSISVDLENKISYTKTDEYVCYHIYTMYTEIFIWWLVYLLNPAYVKFSVWLFFLHFLNVKKFDHFLKSWSHCIC